ncbi:unnamed protein product [marine sediment metagenome]|uniref:Uncharacterized protein n=1 Tax=marine sediment metagenome TaxID=412755 RepID=X1MKK6_9ZZZZ
MKHWSEEREVFIRIRKALSEGTIDGEIISAFPVTLETAIPTVNSKNNSPSGSQ